MSFDPPGENLAFREKFNFPFELLSDEDRTAGLAYGAASDPGAEYPARISYLIGPDGRVAKVYPKVTPATHPDEVLRDLP